MKFFPLLLASLALCACVDAPPKHKVPVKEVYIIQKELSKPPPAPPSQ